MSDVNQEYELYILKMVIDRYLDEAIPMTEDGLQELQNNLDRFVWLFSTRFYRESGHKIEFYRVRDVIIDRIESMRYQIAQEKARLLEQARIAEEKARIEAEKKAREIATRDAEIKEEIYRFLNHFEGDINKASIFVRVRQVISEELDIKREIIGIEDDLFYYVSGYTLSGWNTGLLLFSNWGGDELDTVELVAALEEEFDIEIPDEKPETFKTVRMLVDWITEQLFNK